MDYQLRGDGLERKNRSLAISVVVTNVARVPGTTPDAIKRVTFGSRAIAFDPRGKGVATCSARIPKDGSELECPRRSVVGRGRVEGILGTPGARDDEFGVLSDVAGRFTLHNYKRRPGETARMVAVIATEKPFAGLAINLPASINRFGEVVVTIPPISRLPSFIADAYPAGTKLVLTRLSATVGSADGRHRFATTRTAGRFDARLFAEG